MEMRPIFFSMHDSILLLHFIKKLPKRLEIERMAPLYDDTRLREFLINVPIAIEITVL